MWPYGMTTQDVDEFLEEAGVLLREYLLSGSYDTVMAFLGEYDIELTDWLTNEKGWNINCKMD